MIVIGISGKKRSGKDTAYEIARKHLNSLDIVTGHVAFADRVKWYADKYFGITKDDDKESIRFILQGIGQMLREEINKLYWVNIVDEEIAASKNIDVMFITDLRYRNEVTYVNSLAQGHVIRVVNPRTETPDAHASEMELDDYDFPLVIENSGTLEDLNIAVISTIDEIIKAERKVLNTL